MTAGQAVDTSAEDSLSLASTFAESSEAPRRRNAAWSLAVALSERLEGFLGLARWLFIVALASISGFEVDCGGSVGFENLVFRSCAKFAIGLGFGRCGYMCISIATVIDMLVSVSSQ